MLVAYVNSLSSLVYVSLSWFQGWDVNASKFLTLLVLSFIALGISYAAHRVEVRADLVVSQILAVLESEEITQNVE